MTDSAGASYASLGRRLAAWLLDSAILLFVLLLVAVAMKLFQVVGAWAPAGTGVSPEETWKALGFTAKLFVMFTFVLSLGPLYFVLFEASSRQATFGKQLLSIYVTSDDGKRISIGRGVGRWVAKFVFSWFGIVLVSVITIATTKERKGLHDFAAKTLVLRGRPIPGGAFEPWRIAAALGFPFLWILGTFLATI